MKHAPGVLLVVCGAVFISVLNGSIVNVVLPVIGQEFAVDPGRLGWTMTGYLLVYAVAIPFYGRLADLYGARRMFLFGLGVFALGSLLCSVAPTFPALLAARVVQALGGAAIPGLGIALVSRVVPPERRGTMLGLVSTTLGVGAAIGPIVGGVIADAFGWHTIFLLSAQAGWLVPLAWRLLPRDQPPGEARLDLPGGLFLGLGVTGALLTATEGSRSGWEALEVRAAMALAAIGLLALVVRQRTAGDPFIPRDLLRNARFWVLGSLSFCAMAASLTPFIGLPLMLSAVNGLSPSAVGLAMLPNAALTAALGVVGGRLRDRFGGRLPIRLGLALMLLGMLGLSTAVGAPVWAISALAALNGAGFAFVNTPLSATVSLIVRGERLATAMSLNSMLFFLGGSFGTAALTAVLGARGQAAGAINPLHHGLGPGFSDAFLLLSLPLLAGLALSGLLPGGAERPPAHATRPAPVRTSVPLASEPH